MRDAGYADRVKFLVYTTVFGVLWGLVEMFLGTYMKMVNFPFRGAILASIGGIILCAERRHTPVRYATLTTAIFAALMKIFSFSAVKLGPVVGILIEGMIAETALTLGGNRRMAVFFAVFLASLEGIPHFFATNFIIYGGDIFKVYASAVKQAQGFLGLGGDFWLKALAAWFAGHLLIGAAGGAAAVLVTGRMEDET